MVGREQIAGHKIKQIKYQPGPQEMCLSSRADIVIFGGGAGGGKSYALLLEFLRHIQNPKFTAIIFRKNTTQLRNPGGLWQTSLDLYASLGATSKQATLEWQFPSGATLKMAHLENMDTIYSYQGSQIPLVCIARGTQVLTEKGSKPVEELKVGNSVQTLQGLKKILKIGKKHKPCVKVSVIKDGKVINEQIQSTSHPLLTSFGWFSWDDLKSLCGINSQSIELRDHHKPFLQEEPKFCTPLPNAPRTFLDQEHISKQFELPLDHVYRAGSLAFLINDQNSVLTSDDEHQETLPPRELYVPLVHVSPVFQSNLYAQELSNVPMFSTVKRHAKLLEVWQLRSYYFQLLSEQLRSVSRLLSSELVLCIDGNAYIRALAHTLRLCMFFEDPQSEGSLLLHPGQYHKMLISLSHEAEHALRLLKPLGLTGHCCLCCDQCDERLHLQLRIFQSCLQQLVDVVAQVSLLQSQMDDLLRVPECNQIYRIEYSHPYTKEVLQSYVCGDILACKFTPVESHDVFDLTIESSNHYITESGLVNENCFDELTHFDEHSFWYLLSRLRSTSGVAGYIRATTNPEPGWVADLISWWIGPDGFPIKERSGILRWFIRQNDSLIWSNSKEELINEYGKEQMPKSLTFIPSLVRDNKILMEKDPTYISNLMALSRVDRMRLLDGNWNVKATSGLLFRREWFPLVDAVPAAPSQMIRFWDRAASKISETNKDPDWTRGLKLYKYPDGTFCIVDLRSARDTPGQIETLVKNVAGHDSYSVQIMSQQDPGSAGVSEAQHFTRMLAGYPVRVETMSKDKITRSKAVSAQAEAGNIKVLRAAWNEELFTELENFPDGAHDDIVDCLSGAFNALSRSRSILDVI